MTGELTVQPAMPKVLKAADQKSGKADGQPLNTGTTHRSTSALDYRTRMKIHSLVRMFCIWRFVVLLLPPPHHLVGTNALNTLSWEANFKRAPYANDPKGPYTSLTRFARMTETI